MQSKLLRTLEAFRRAEKREARIIDAYNRGYATVRDVQKVVGMTMTALKRHIEAGGDYPNSGR